MVHRDSLENDVHGARRFDTLHIRNLACDLVCYIQGVNIQSWINQMVYLANNHTIQGTTILENPEILNSIQ